MYLPSSFIHVLSLRYVRSKLGLNSKKTEYMLISSPHMRNTITSIDVTVGRETVSPSDSARNLGVYFDKSMNMDRHISHICQTAYFQLRKVAAIRPFLTHAAAETLIHSLITSRLDFCNSLLAGLPSSSLNRLQAVQNAAARLLMKKKKFDHITPILTELHWIPVRKRIQFKVLLLTFKALHDRSPGYISSLIEERKLRPGLRTTPFKLTTSGRHPLFDPDGRLGRTVDDIHEAKYRHHSNTTSRLVRTPDVFQLSIHNTIICVNINACAYHAIDMESSSLKSDIFYNYFIRYLDDIFQQQNIF